MIRHLDKLANEQKLFRRLILIWAVVLTTVVALRVTQPSVLSSATEAGATIAVAAIGILATVIGLYQWMRQQDDKRARGD